MKIITTAEVELIPRMPGGLAWRGVVTQVTDDGYVWVSWSDGICSRVRDSFLRVIR